MYTLLTAEVPLTIHVTTRSKLLNTLTTAKLVMKFVALSYNPEVHYCIHVTVTDASFKPAQSSPHLTSSKAP